MGIHAKNGYVNCYLKKSDHKSILEMSENDVIFKGISKRGLQLARTFGVPTMNVHSLNEYEVIRPGVYAGLLKIGERVYACCAYLRGESDESEYIQIEAHALCVQLSEDMYEQQVEVKLLHFIRDFKDFGVLSQQQIISQIQEDCKQATEYFYQNRKHYCQQQISTL